MRAEFFHTDIGTYIRTDVQADRHMGGQTDGRTDGQTDGRTDTEGQTRTDGHGRTDGQTDRQADLQMNLSKPIIGFRSYANASKICCGSGMEEIRVFKNPKPACQNKKSRKVGFEEATPVFTKS